MSETRGDVTGGGLAEVVLALAEELDERCQSREGRMHRVARDLRAAVAAATAETPRGDDRAVHIAAFDPPTCLSLLDRLADAEAAVIRVRAALAAAGDAVALGGVRVSASSVRPMPSPYLIERLHDLDDVAAEFGVDLTDEREERP